MLPLPADAHGQHRSVLLLPTPARPVTGMPTVTDESDNCDSSVDMEITTHVDSAPVFTCAAADGLRGWFLHLRADVHGDRYG